MSYRLLCLDLSGMLIDWHPECLYRKLFGDERQMRWFLSHVCTTAWNEQQDAGRLFAEGTRLLVQRFPEWALMIQAYCKCWEEVLAGPIEPSIAFLHKLKKRGYPRLLVLANWSAETFPIVRQRFDFLDWFEGIVVSGEEGTRKPFPKFIGACW